MNPVLNLDTYIPDIEPHVFDGRLYLYGSHDKKGGEKFCMDNYEFFSSSILDLENFTSKGISYNKKEDIHALDKNKEVELYAPDCVKGNDGKYYLYYVAMGSNTRPFGPISVAKSDYPDGPFSYLGDLRYKDGSLVLKYLTNDPGVINDNGRIYLYYGWGLNRDFSNKLFKPLFNLVLHFLTKRSLKDIKNTIPSILSCAFCEIDPSDMLTVIDGPKAVLDSKTSANKKDELYKHAFYEAPSIRKFNDTYYLIYSSGENNELCYATSKYPDKDFIYQGVLISSANVGYKNNKHLDDNIGVTIHGSIEEISKDNYVLFYHRLTNQSDYERWAYAERIYMDKNGKFNQVEMTTNGLSSFLPKGKYLAIRECGLYNEHTGKIISRKKRNTPYKTFNKDKEDEYYITNLNGRSEAIFKYFDVTNLAKISATLRGVGKGILNIYLNNTKVGSISLESSTTWKEYSLGIPLFSSSKCEIKFSFILDKESKFDFLDFSIK